MNSNENLAPLVVARLMKDIRSLCKNPPEGIRVSVNEENISIIHAEIDGPVGTPFEGGLFRVKLLLGADFPQSPPKGFFVTKLFHPNVSDSGEICVNTLKKDWKPTHGLEHVLLVIRCLLIVPNAESALNPEAGKLLLENYDDFAKRAQLMTRIHAKPKKPEVAAAAAAAAGSGAAVLAPAKKKLSDDDSSSVGPSSSAVERENKNASGANANAAIPASNSAVSKVSIQPPKMPAKPATKSALKRL